MRGWYAALFLAAVYCITLQPAGPALGQQTLAVRITGVDLSAYPEIRATVSVADETDRPVSGLAQEGFSAASGGTPLPVTGVLPSTDPGLGIAVVLTVDVSGSMAGEPLAAAREAGRRFVSQLGPDDQVALLAFAGDVRVQHPFSRDREALAAAIDGLLSGGNTALYSAVVESVAMAGSSGLPRRAVVLLSDGTDFGGVSTVDGPGSLAAVAASGTPFFIVGLGGLIDEPYLRQLAEVSRGQLRLAPGPADLEALFENIGAMLRHQYVLTIDASALRAGGPAPLEITVSGPQGTGVAAGALDLPQGAPPPAATPEPAASPASEATEAPPAAGSDDPAAGSGAGLLPFIVAGAGIGGGLGVVAVYFLRRRRPGDQENENGVRLPDMGQRAAARPAPQAPAVAPPPPSRVDGYLELLTPEGPRRYPLGEAPVTVGYTSDATISLADGFVTRWERVRIWSREGRFMLHNLSSMGSVTIAGRPVSWAVLEDGDEIQIGGHRLVFHQGAPPPAAG
jgi:hypothetical protein